MGQGMRLDDWASKMNEVIDKARTTPFEWGVSDCALFAADCVKAMTGFDWAEPFRGRYKTPRGSLLALKKYGNGSLEKTMDASFERHSKIALTRRGDVVAMDNPAGVCLGICVGSIVAVRSEKGVEFFPVKQAIASWRVD